VNLQLQVSHAIENQLHKTVAKWQISSSECKNQIWPESMPNTPLKEQMNNGTTKDGVTEGKFYLRALR
jgi:hypothetical protein